MKRVISILVIAAFLVAPAFVGAQQAKPATPAAPVAPAAPAATVAPAAPAATAAPAKAAEVTVKKVEPVTLTGVVEAVKDDKGKVTGYALKTDTETLGMKGEKIAAMLGKKIEATGIVATIKDKKVLTVTKMKEVD